MGRIWIDLLQDLEDLPSLVKGGELTNLLQSDPIRGQRPVVFYAHGKTCLGTDVTNVTSRSHQPYHDRDQDPFCPPDSHFTTLFVYVRPLNVLCFIMGGAGVILICSASVDARLIRVG